MRRFRFVDQEGEQILTEQQILDQYFEYWSGKMHELGRDDQITNENCITDFCVIHWADEI